MNNHNTTSKNKANIRHTQWPYFAWVSQVELSFLAVSSWEVVQSSAGHIHQWDVSLQEVQVYQSSVGLLDILTLSLLTVPSP